MSAPTFRTPNEMLAKGIELMLDGRQPETEADWARLVNFWAANVHQDCAHAAVQLMCTIYDVPLTKAQVAAIVDFQLTH